MQSTDKSTDKKTHDFHGFTAPASAPGQDVSRASKREIDQFLDEFGENGPAWRQRYFDLLAEQADRPKDEQWDWRKCLFVAWKSLPSSLRWPKTIREFADFVGVQPSTIRHWRRNDPLLDERVGDMRARLVDEHVSDLLQASINCGLEDGPQGHQDRKMLLEMAGLYRPKTQQEISGPGSGPIVVKSEELSDEELLRIATGGSGGAAGQENSAA